MNPGPEKGASNKIRFINQLREVRVRSLAQTKNEMTHDPTRTSLIDATIQEVQREAYADIADILRRIPDAHIEGPIVYAAASYLTSHQFLAKLSSAATSLEQSQALSHDELYDARMLALARTAMPEYAEFPPPPVAGEA